MLWRRLGREEEDLASALPGELSPFSAPLLRARAAGEEDLRKPRSEEERGEGVERECEWECECEWEWE